MQIILRGPAAGYEAEHTARIFFPGAEKAEDLPETEDFVLAESHEMTDLILVRKDGRIYWRTDLRSPEADPEYALCKLEFGLLKDLTGIDPPWGMMTGVRRCASSTTCARRGRARRLSLKSSSTTSPARRKNSSWRWALRTCSALCWTPPTPWIAASMRASRSARPGAATAALSPARWGIKPPVRFVQPYVDKLCEELTAIRRTADRAGLHIRTFYIGGGTPTSLNAPQLEQLMSHIAKTFV